MSKKFKSFNFWLGLFSAILILIQSVLKPFGLQISEDVYMSIVNALLSVFVVLGVISNPKDETANEDKNDQNSDKI